VLTSGRDLITLKETAPSGGAPLVIANPNYDRKTRASGTAVYIALPQQLSAGVASSRWDPLPASSAEGKQLASLLGTHAITGDQATVPLLQGSRGPRILHIASHGFFEPDQEIPPDDLPRAWEGSNQLVAGFRGEDPLLRSGIVLAGANNPGLDPNDDGLLTAQEAVGLQLDGTELVVLSACSTGQGDVRTGEGVYGLQRALTVAGARSTCSRSGRWTTPPPPSSWCASTGVSRPAKAVPMPWLLCRPSSATAPCKGPAVRTGARPTTGRLGSSLATGDQSKGFDSHRLRLQNHTGITRHWRERGGHSLSVRHVLPDPGAGALQRAGGEPVAGWCQRCQ
jgi:hypothetical protein